jgi:hypothetical protein
MVAVVLVLMLQATPPTRQPPVELPVSLDKVREGLSRRSPFEIPPHSPWARVFRVKVEAWEAFAPKVWAEPSAQGWVRAAAPQSHVDFLQSTTPEHVRSSSMYPCCNATPALETITTFVQGRVRSIKEGRAKREVAEAMRAAGIAR